MTFFRTCLLSALTLFVSGNLNAADLEPVCARTPAMALRAMNSNVIAGMLAQAGGGYRIATVRLDPLLHRRWAMVASCDYPGRPFIAIPLPEMERRSIQTSVMDNGGVESQLSTPFPVVHSGDLVQLRGYEKNLRVEISGKAEESGAVGSIVHVRLLGSGFDIGRQQTLSGIVRGPGEVEIRP